MMFWNLMNLCFGLMRFCLKNVVMSVVISGYMMMVVSSVRLGVVRRRVNILFER